MWYAVVSFGGQVRGAGSAYSSEEQAMERIIRAERDTQCGGRYHSDKQALATARIYGYRTRAAALRADISDTARQGLVSQRVISRGA